jgi:beta-xylosidase
MRTQRVHRSKSLFGPWEGRVFLQDRGIAQGGIIDTPEGKWFTYLFGDRGAVGRIPYLAPVEWKDGWPVVVGDKVPDSLPIANKGRGFSSLVASDDFERQSGEKPFGLAWQWNHNPVDSLWTLQERPGFLRLRTDRADANLERARNTLTQRTFGPESVAETHLDFGSMRVGDFAGLCLLQRRYGFVGVERRSDGFYAVTVSNADLTPNVIAEHKLDGTKIWLRAKGDFAAQEDRGTFAFHDGDGQWRTLGGELAMRYDLPHFMGYRFGLFFFSTREPGGFVDFDYYRVK